MIFKSSLPPFLTLGVIALLSPGSLSYAQDFFHIAGEDNIGAESLPSVTEGAEMVATVPNSGGTWSCDGSEGVVSSNLSSPTYTIPTAGPVALTFSHRYNFEDDGAIRYDAGAVFVIVNGGAPTYLDGSAFTQNGYDGFGAGGDGRPVNGNCPPIGAAAPDGKFGFGGKSSGFDGGTMIESLASVGTLASGDTISIIFVGAWDEGTVQTPAPNWDVSNFSLSDSGGASAFVDFSDGHGGFTVSNVGGVAGPWAYVGAPAIVFEADADSLSTDHFVVDPVAANTFIDLNGANFIVEMSGTLDVGDSFQLFEGGQIRGTYGNLALPDGQWDLSGLEPGGNGIITYLSHALSGWLVRDLDVVGGGGDGNVDSIPDAFYMLQQTATANFVLQGDRTEVRKILDLAGDAGNFGVNDLYPGSNIVSDKSRDDFIIFATSQVTIPAGTWSIAIGSDDGGFIQLLGVDFSTGADGGESRFGEDTVPVRRNLHSVRYEGTRLHGWTGGTFILTEPLTTKLTAIMFERGGGDSVEVAIRDASGEIDNDPTDSASGWELLEDGLQGWTVRSGTTTRERGEGIHVGGLDSLRPEALATGGSSLRDAQYGAITQTPGLSQEWWQLPNPETKAGMEILFASAPADVGPFKGSDNGGSGTWWTGDSNALTGIQTYPPATSPLARDNYIVRLSGEILIPESGVIRFKDGVDDYCYLAIDLNKNGIVGEADDGNGQSEILINDSTWTNVKSKGNGGSPIAERTFSVAAGGEWLAVDINIGEGFGGDNAVLYWDYGVGIGGIGAGVDFPAGQGDSVNLGNAAALLIPDSHLRSSQAPLLSADLVLGLERDIPYEFEIMEDETHDKLSVTNPDPSIYTTVLDLEGVHLKVIFPGESPGANTTFDLIDADIIEGNYASLTLPNGTWDTSGLDPGGDGTITLVDNFIFEITAVSHDRDSNTTSLTFNSIDEHRYAIDRLGEDSPWFEITDDVQSMGSSTNWTDTTILPDTKRRIYRVRDLGIPAD